MAATLCRVAAAARLGVVRGAARAPAAASAAVALATAAAATPLTTGVHAAAKVSGSGRAGYSSQAAQFSGVDAATRFADLVRSEAAPAEAQAVLDFWFEYKEGEAIDQRMWWWVSSDETDAAIRAKFETLVQKAQAGGLKDWEDTFTGSIAKIILLDQFSRNLYRGTAQAFAGDAEACRISLALLDRFPTFTSDQSLPVPVRHFAIMPLEHSEDPALHRRVILHCGAILQGQDGLLVKAAWEHFEVMTRFGRYPHRNKVLGRTNTDAEEAYLNDPDAKSWGQ